MRMYESNTYAITLITGCIMQACMNDDEMQLMSLAQAQHGGRKQINAFPHQGHGFCYDVIICSRTVVFTADNCMTADLKVTLHELNLLYLTHACRPAVPPVPPVLMVAAASSTSLPQVPQAAAHPPVPNQMARHRG